MNSVFLCDGVRTPIGRFGGSLASVRPDDMAADVLRALVARNPGLDPSAIDDVFLGCVNQAGEDNRNVARMALLLAGLPETVPGVTINRLCASGADAVGTAARAIAAGEIDLAIAGGVESMTRAPFVMAKADKAWGRAAMLEDTTIGWRMINPAMRQAYGVESMPETAENVATSYGISRADQDGFALRSQQRTAAAQAAGFFDGEIITIGVADKKSTRLFAVDEHPRGDTSYDSLAKLQPIVRADGTVTAGNASGVNDGAAALILASRAAVETHGLTPRARFLGMATAGVAPRVMGIGPVPAIRKLLARLKLSIGDFGTIELNEAFAAQAIACLRELAVDPAADHVNRNGGAIALGHPLGASGARLVLTAMRQVEQSGGRRALISMCIGVGQGIALALEGL